MQPVAPAPTRHQPSCELVHNDDFAVFHHIVHVSLVERVGLQGLDHVMDHVHVGRIVQIVHAQ